MECRENGTGSGKECWHKYLSFQTVAKLGLVGIKAVFDKNKVFGTFLIPIKLGHYKGKMMSEKEL